VSIRKNADRIQEIQDEVMAWSEYNFGPQVPGRPVLGAIEELGEVAHSVLKRSQGIRGTAEEHDAKIKDGLADYGVFLLNSLGFLTFDTGKYLARRIGDALDLPPLGGSREENDTPLVMGMAIMQGHVCSIFMEFMASGIAAANAGEDDTEAWASVYLKAENLGRRICQSLLYAEQVAKSLGWNYMEILEATWAEVKKRDFKKDPASGGNIKPEETVLREAASAIVDSPSDDDDFIPQFQGGTGVRDLPREALRPTAYTVADDIGGFA
jgi:hypothetical protein